MNRTIFQKLTLPMFCVALMSSALAISITNASPVFAYSPNPARATDSEAETTVSPASKTYEFSEMGTMKMKELMFFADMVAYDATEFDTPDTVGLIPLDVDAQLSTEDFFISRGDMPEFEFVENVVSEGIVPVDIQADDAKEPITIEPAVPEPVIEIKTVHFNPWNITEPSNMSLADIEDFVARRCPEWRGLEGYLQSLDSRINLVFLFAVARMETWAGSECVGYYNCFNIRNPDGSYTDYSSYTASIDDFVRLILDEYVNPDGLWHEGESISSIGVHYAEAASWADAITELGYEISYRYSE